MTTATLDRTFTGWTASIEAKITRLRVDKDITLPNGDIKVKTFFVPMKQVVVALRNGKGGYVVYRSTTMGKRTTVSRSTGLPGTPTKNKEATGPAYLINDRPIPLKIEQATATISRMCGISMTEAAEMFDADAIIASGELVEASA